MLRILKCGVKEYIIYRLLQYYSGFFTVVFIYFDIVSPVEHTGLPEETGSEHSPLVQQVSHGVRILKHTPQLYSEHGLMNGFNKT